MAIHNLDKFFNPTRIALIGVSKNPLSVSGQVLKNLVGSGFQGVVYPVNPTCEAVLGVPCVASLDEIPKIPDLAIICTAAEEVPGYVLQACQKGTRAIIIMSAGFGEIGEEGRKLEREILEIKNQFAGTRIIGPNCLGLINPGIKLNASFAGDMPEKGHIAFISQSGALCTSVLDWAIQEKIGFSKFISIGNTLDVDFADLIDYLGEDEETKSIILYVESIKHARSFMTATRAFARNMPIVAYKAGRFPKSSEVAASHTGAMASEDAIYDAAFKRSGIARVFDIGEIFNVAELIARVKPPKGRRLAIVTNAGGPGVMATDALIAENGELAELLPETIEKLNENLPHFWSHGNPVDILGDARTKRLAKAVRIVVEDKNVDAVLVILTPQAMTNPTSAAKAVSEIAQETSKPILAAWLGGKSMSEGISIFNENKIPAYTTPEAAIKAFMTLVDYARNLESLYETPEDISVEFPLDRKSIREKIEMIISSTKGILPENLSKAVLESYGIPTTMPRIAENADRAVEIAEEIGYPVVLKIHSQDITHKTDVGGVALDIRDEKMVKAAFERIIESVKNAKPEARIEGVSVQPMVHTKDATEMILGVKRDAVFGTTIMAGMGGTAAELLKDTVLEFPPLNENLARRMIESLKIYPLMDGYRGRPKGNIDKLIEVLIRLSYFAADFPDVIELDINPLLVTPDNAIALDARIVIDKTAISIDDKPYSHLALRPYPEEYANETTLPDGTPITLRPIKPEDEPMWFELLGSCSRESIYMRFRYFFDWRTHEVASRYCFNDYDREIAIVAEIDEDGKRKLLGVGRLAADPDHDSVEYAVLVADKWQNRKLGSLLTDYCIEVAKRWGLKKIVAQTTSDNPRMIAVFERRGFEIEFHGNSDIVDVEKDLSP